MCGECNWPVKICERCKHECILCPAVWPLNEEFWICPSCESTYCIEKKDER
jgi:hypothetical protein